MEPVPCPKKRSLALRCRFCKTLEPYDGTRVDCGGTVRYVPQNAWAPEHPVPTLHEQPCPRCQGPRECTRARLVADEPYRYTCGVCGHVFTL